MKALAITTEGLGIGMVGTYGASTCVTPALDRLAAQGLVLDQCFADSCNLRDQLTSLWSATHAALRSLRPLEWTLWQALERQGIPAHLITDCRVSAEVATELGCKRITLVEPLTNATPAEDSEDCGLTAVFAAAMDELSNPNCHGLVWVHAKGLLLPWDAPIELRHSFIDPEDPDPPSTVELPNFPVTDETDPDLVVGWGQVAAAQVAILDQAIDGLEQTVAQRDDACEWAWMIASLCGYPLGEHGQVGPCDETLTSESIALPAVFRPSHQTSIGHRRSELCQIPDLVPTLLDACRQSLAAPELSACLAWGKSLLLDTPPLAAADWPVEHMLAWIAGQSSRTLRTVAWSIIEKKTDDETSPVKLELYVKPDDRWETSDIASRRGDIAHQLLELLESIPQLFSQSGRSALPRLPRELTNVIR